MKHEVNPQETCRAKAFGLWMKSPVPMVTFTKTFDVTRLYKVWLPISMQFHHAQMDGGHAAQYLEDLQQTINRL